MSIFELKSLIRVACAKRISPYLEEEIKNLGYIPLQVTDTGIDLNGTLEDCMKLNLYLHTAFRVLFLIHEFEAEGPEPLYEAIKDLTWEDYVPADGYVCISSFVQNDHIRDTRFANLKVKDAIVDRIYKVKKRRPDSGPNTDRTVVFLYWKEQNASIFIDTSGDTIAKHGYRKTTVKAPMQEALAAATIFASKWDKNSAFVNPMCGSGTLAIEAALIAIEKGPGLLRANFGFMHLPGYEPKTWKALQNEAVEKIKGDLPFRIIATDNNFKAMQAAQENAQIAKVDHLIEFRKCDFEESPIPDENKGIVMLNPEYGERLGDEESLEPVYKGIGDFFKQKCKGYTGYVFTGNPELAKKIGLKAKRRIPFYNATIDCRLLEFELYEGSMAKPKKTADEADVS